MSTRKTAIDKAIDALDAERKVIELAITKLRAQQNEKKPAPRLRRVAAAAEGATK